MHYPCPFPTTLPTMDIGNFLNDPKEKIWRGPFSFIVGADPQFGLIDRYILQKDNFTNEPEVKLVTDAIKEINSLVPKPRFLIVCGDLLDAKPDMEEEIQIRKVQLADYFRSFRELDPEIKLISVCGNHDICDIPTRESLQLYRDSFGPDYFEFWVGGVKFSVLNSQYFRNPVNVEEEAKEHLEFVQKTLTDIGPNHHVLFQHIPYFINDPEESDVEYLNLPKKVREEVLEKIDRAGVKIVFTGHYHQNAGGMYKNVSQVVTGSMGGHWGKDPSGFRIVHVLKDSIEHQYFPIEICDQSNRHFKI